ncbi:MAG: hypothetical protein NVSMB42_02590 [Herpetosiphon sp.]
MIGQAYQGFMLDGESERLNLQRFHAPRQPIEIDTQRIRGKFRAQASKRVRVIAFDVQLLA